MMRGVSIRARLTLWFSFVLVLCLVAFGVTVWFGLRQSLLETRQAELQERMNSLRGVLQAIPEAPAEGADGLADEVSEFSKASPSGFSLWLRDASNAVIFQSPSSPSARVLEREESARAGTLALTIRMSLSLAPDDEILARLSHILFWSIPLAILAASCCGYWLSKLALAPVRDMALAAQSINSSDLTLRLPVPPANDELSLLARKWNEMLDRLQGGIEKVQRFTSDASHDLRTPLATIRASAEIALRREREPESYRDTLSRIIGQADRATTLVEDLLTLARADSGTIDLVLLPLDLRSSLQEICETLRPLVQAKNLELRQSLPSSPVWVNANSNAMMRVVTILVDNAMKNTEAGWIQIHLQLTEVEAVLQVEDTGSGIASGDLAHVFDRFYRGDKSRTSVNGGSGLGLAIAKSLMEFHHGTIAVESQPRQGTRFVVRLPLRQTV